MHNFAPINVLSLRNGEGRGRPASSPTGHFDIFCLTEGGKVCQSAILPKSGQRSTYLLSLRKEGLSPKRVLLPDAIKTLINNVDLLSTLNHYDRGKLHNSNKA